MDSRPPTNQAPTAAAQELSSHKQLAAAYDRHAEGLYRYAAIILANPSAAEDVVQQVFVRLAQMGERISQVSSREGYLRTAVRHECFRTLRRRTPKALSSGAAAMLEAATPGGLDSDQLGAIDRALRKLPPDQREVVHLKVYEQMTFAQIAEVTGTSPNTAASRYRYATDKLRRLLTPNAEDPNDASA